MSALRTRPVPTRRLAVASCTVAVLAGGLVLPEAAGAVEESAGAPRAKMVLEIGGTQFLEGEKIDARIINGQAGCKATITLSGNNEGGSASVKIGADGTAEAVFVDIPAATGTYFLTATVKASSKCKQASAQDDFHVYDPTVTGPKKVSAGSDVTIKASGYPAGAKISWIVTRNGNRLTTGTTKANSSGKSSLVVNANKAGNYSVKGVSGKFYDSWTFAAS